MQSKNWKEVYNHIDKHTQKKFPWLRTSPPFWFLEVLESKWVTACKTLDVGCGNGFFSFYLSNLGFEVKGIDISKSIIQVAKKNFLNQNLYFFVGDVLEHDFLSEEFEFVLDVGLFHNIQPSKRKLYSKRIYDLLSDDGKFLIFCFDKRESTFRNEKEYINPRHKTLSFPLSKKEIFLSFEEHFVIEEIKEISYGTQGYKKRFLCFLRKK